MDFVAIQHSETFFGRDFRGAGKSLATLNDPDGIRGNGNETGAFTDAQEVRATVLLSDGSTASILGLRESSIRNFGISIRRYVFEEETLEARGLGVQDVVQVLSFTQVNHNLSFAELGFQPGTTRPIPAPVNAQPDANADSENIIIGETVSGNALANDTDADGDALTARLLSNATTEFGTLTFQSNGDYSFASSGTVDRFERVTFEYEITDGILTDTATIQIALNAPPPPPPVIANQSLVLGTDGDETIAGNSGNNIIISGAGSDQLSGGAGRDVFVFGADALNGTQEIDVITDFNPDEDAIVIEQGLDVRNVFFSDGFAVIQLFGTDDLIRVASSTGTTFVRQNTFEVQGSYLDSLSITPEPDPQPDPDPEPEPEPEPVINVINGTSGRDRLSGTDEADIISGGRNHDRLFGRDGDDVLIGGADNDRLWGGDGEDTFVFGADDRDFDRDRDIIYDFDASEDTIFLEDGATIRRVVEWRDDTYIQLNGDRDLIILRDTDRNEVESNIVFSDDLFLS